jgi:hypothetical protein
MSVCPLHASATHSDITITLLCHRDNSLRRFTVSPRLHVDAFLEQVLAELAQGDDAERVRQLRECYEPVLELVRDGKGTALTTSQTLGEAGVDDDAVCQIAAYPLKEKLMFCRYSRQA